MRVFRAGDGSDSTAAVQAYLADSLITEQLTVADLYLIGDPDDPMAFWLTNWDTSLQWPVWGTFRPAVISRGSVAFKVGLEVSTLDVKWSPPKGTFTNNVNTTSPYQLAIMGYFDNWPFRLWKLFMPTPGDASTLGACEWFGGRIADVEVKRGEINFTINSFLDVVNQYCPTNVIELLNTLAAYKGAAPPPGFTHIPQFNVIETSGTQFVYGDQTYPVAHSVLNTNVVRNGFLVFNSTPNATLGGVFSAIAQNFNMLIGGIHYSGFQLYTPLPWSPTPGVDTFYVSAPNKILQSDGDYYGFPYVPYPESAATGGL